MSRTFGNMKTLSSLVLALATASYAQSTGAQLVAQLRDAPTQVDRINLLSDSDYLFNFLAPPSGVTTGSGGHTVASSSENFPAVVGNGVSMTIGFLGPCGMNSPHTHPRATEINFSLNTTLRAGFLSENGARFIPVDIAPGKAAVFPQGAIHFEMNPSCESAMFVAGFNGEDPGVQQVAQRYFGLPPDIVGATLGGLGVVEVAGLESKIPDNVIYGVDECLQRCNITRGDQPTLQREPRNSANALPSGYSGPTPASAAPASTSKAASYSYSYSSIYATPVSSYTSYSAPAAAQTFAVSASPAIAAPSGVPLANDDFVLAASPSAQSDSGFSIMNYNPILIALVAVNAAILVGIVIGLFVLIRSRKRSANYASHQYILPASSIPVMYKTGHQSGYESGETTAYTPNSEDGLLRK